MMTRQLQIATGPIEQAIVGVLRAGRAVEIRDLVDAVYQGVPDPPDGADRVIREALRRLCGKGYEIRQPFVGCWRMTAMPVIRLESLLGSEERRKEAAMQAGVPDAVAAILRDVAQQARMTPEELCGVCRQRRHVRARWLAMERLQARGNSTTQIGAWLGGRDHTSIVHGLAQMKLLRQLGLNDAAVLAGIGPSSCNRNTTGGMAA